MKIQNTDTNNSSTEPPSRSSIFSEELLPSKTFKTISQGKCSTLITPAETIPNASLIIPEIKSQRCVSFRKITNFRERLDFFADIFQAGWRDTFISNSEQMERNSAFQPLYSEFENKYPIGNRVHLMVPFGGYNERFSRR